MRGPAGSAPERGGWGRAAARGHHPRQPALFEGRLEDAADPLPAGHATPPTAPARVSSPIGSETARPRLRRRPRADEAATALLAEVGARPGPHAAYAWYCAGEADLGGDVERARERFAVPSSGGADGRVVRRGVAGTSNASIEARLGDPAAAAEEYRRLIAHWRRAGVWSTQWTMLRSVAGLLERLGRPLERPSCSARCWRRRRAIASSATTRGAHRAHRPVADDARRRRLRSRARPGRGSTATRPSRAGVVGSATVTSLRSLSRSAHQRGCSAAMPSTALPTISWVSASLPGWNPPQRTSR